MSKGWCSRFFCLLRCVTCGEPCPKRYLGDEIEEWRWARDHPYRAERRTAVYRINLGCCGVLLHLCCAQRSMSKSLTIS
jgi:hypothetical protein